MHLIVAIAVGVFGGLWLFMCWFEWREARQELRLYPRPERSPMTQGRMYGWIVGVGVLAVCVMGVFGG